MSILLLVVMGPKAIRTQKLMPAGLVTVRELGARSAKRADPSPFEQILSLIMLVRFGMRLL